MNPSDERSVRLAKLNAIRAFGIPAYPQNYQKDHKLSALKQIGEENVLRSHDEVVQNPQTLFSTAGRIVLFRSFGSLAFAHLQDDSGRFQVMFSKTNLRINADGVLCEKIGEGEKQISAFKFLEKYMDIGDFIGVKGELLRTQKGELTLFAAEFSFLGKALSPLPEKFHGIADDETKYRQRYLDLITDGETMERFAFRSEFLRHLREFYHREGFTEIEGQTLTNCPTGAAAKPYVTHQNSL